MLSRKPLRAVGLRQYKFIHHLMAGPPERQLDGKREVRVTGLTAGSESQEEGLVKS